MIVSKPAIIFHISQIFFNFLAMACFASVASFQAKWKIGPCECSSPLYFHHHPSNPTNHPSPPQTLHSYSFVLFYHSKRCSFIYFLQFNCADWTQCIAGLSGFAIFVSVSGIFLALFLLFVPVMYEKYD